MTIDLDGRRYRIRRGLNLATLPDHRTAPAAFLLAILPDGATLPSVSEWTLYAVAATAWHDLMRAAPSYAVDSL
jgi:hypothetical protein